MRILALVAALALGWTNIVQADVLKMNTIPADAKWLVHLDVDGMRSSQVMQKFYHECVQQCPEAEKWFAKVKEKWGIDLHTDLHGITAYGSTFVPHHCVLIVHSNVDREVMLQEAQKAPDHKAAKYRDYEIHTWTDKTRGKPQEGAGVFYKPDVMVFATGADRLKSALDVLDGKSPGVSKSSPLAAAVSPGTLFLARATGLNSAKLPATCPLVKLIKGFDYAEGEHNGTWFGNIGVTAESPQVTGQLKQAFQGFLAVFSLHFHDQPGIVKLMDQVKVTTEGSTVHAAFKAPADAVVAQVPVLCKFLGEHVRMHMMHEKMAREKKSVPAKPEKKAKEEKRVGV